MMNKNLLHPLASEVLISERTYPNLWFISSKVAAIATKNLAADDKQLGFTTGFLLANKLVNKQELLSNYNAVTQRDSYILLIEKIYENLNTKAESVTL